MEDKKDEDLEEMKQIDKDIRNNSKCSKEKESMNQEITTNAKEEWPPPPPLENHFTLHFSPFSTSIVDFD